jgi:hypothetical protein
MVVGGRGCTYQGTLRVLLSFKKLASNVCTEVYSEYRVQRIHEIWGVITRSTEKSMDLLPPKWSLNSGTSFFLHVPDLNAHRVAGLERQSFNHTSQLGLGILVAAAAPVTAPVSFPPENGIPVTGTDLGIFQMS